jgi:hypothetical protein
LFVGLKVPRTKCAPGGVRDGKLQDFQGVYGIDGSHARGASSALFFLHLQLCEVCNRSWANPKSNRTLVHCAFQVVY